MTFVADELGLVRDGEQRDGQVGDGLNRLDDAGAAVAAQHDPVAFGIGHGDVVIDQENRTGIDAAVGAAGVEAVGLVSP